MSVPHAQDILVIGYGNELRGDDGAGPAAARAIEALALPGVRVFVQQQLTPDLAEAIAAARALILMDARQATAAAQVVPQALSPTPGELRTHISNPAALLALAKALYGRCPPAWLVTIPATTFDFGQRLSPGAQAGVEAAVEVVQALCQSAPLAAP